MIWPEHPFDIRPDLRKAASTKAESTTAESVIRPKQLVRPVAVQPVDSVVASAELSEAGNN
jgi:hypothetical protein